MLPHSGTGVSIPAPNYLPPLPTKHRSSRSNSLSSSSVITVKRSSSPGGHSRESVVQIRSTSPVKSALLAVRALKSGFTQSTGRRTSVTQDLAEGESLGSEGTANLNRWSHSSASSISSARNGRQVRPNSSAGQSMSADLWTQRRPSASSGASPRRPQTSPRSSPSRQPISAADARTDKYRHRVPSANSTRAASSNQTAQQSMLSPLESRSPTMRRPLTPGSTGLLTPASYSNSTDYFGIAVSKDSPQPNDISPMSPAASRYSSARTPLETPGGGGRDRSKDKDLTEEERAEASKRRYVNHPKIVDTRHVLTTNADRA